MRKSAFLVAKFNYHPKASKANQPIGPIYFPQKTLQKVADAISTNKME
jgi:hypothetical protein